MKLSTFNGHAINDRINYLGSILPTKYGGLPGVNVLLGERTGSWPLASSIDRPGKEIPLEIFILGADIFTLQKQLHQWFDPEAELPGTLVGEDDAGGNPRYVMALCKNMQPVPGSKGKKWIVTLQIDGDIRWWEVTPATDSWNITATGQTKNLTNNGQDDAYPILKIKPTSNKTGGYSYKRWVAIKWLLDENASKYPIDICNNGLDTAALITAGKMQADGDDLRVVVNGGYVERWLQDINTTTTQVWVTLSMNATTVKTLAANITSGATSLQVTSTDAIREMSGTGIIYIGTEAITYTGKNNVSREFTGLTRGAKGTTAAAHTAGDAVYWIQYDSWIIYGNSAVSAPSTLNTYKPLFELNSTNTSWDFNDFKHTVNPDRPGTWVQSTLQGAPRFYGGNHGASPGFYVELGIECDPPLLIDEGRFQFYHPCGIVSANFQNGEKYSQIIGAWPTGTGQVKSRIPGDVWLTEYNVPAPSVDATWESWSQNITLTVGSKYVAIYLKQYSGVLSSLEVADVTLALDSTYTPVIVLGAEQGNYSLDATITNNTTGKSLQLSFIMALNQQLEIDTAEKELIYLLDNSKQFSALTLSGGARRDWLALQPGVNQIQFDDTGTNAVTIDFEWQERHYQ